MRSEALGSCVRCARANALCVYSPTDRLGRPPDKSRQENQPGPGNSTRKRQRHVADVEMDWMGASNSGLEKSMLDENLWGKVICTKTEKTANGN